MIVRKKQKQIPNLIIPALLKLSRRKIGNTKTNCTSKMHRHWQTHTHFCVDRNTLLSPTPLHVGPRLGAVCKMRSPVTLVGHTGNIKDDRFCRIRVSVCIKRGNGLRPQLNATKTCLLPQWVYHNYVGKMENVKHASMCVLFKNPAHPCESGLTKP